MLKEVADSNTKASLRILSFDLARGLAVLFMILIHVSDFYGNSEYQSSGLAYFFKLLGEAPAAPVFMLIMGIFIAFSPIKSVASGLKRALALILLGYVLNFLRASLPMWIGIKTGIVTQEELGSYTPLTELLIVDILQFAGLAFGICVLLRGYLNHVGSWLALAVIVTFISPFLWGIQSESVWLNAILALLWGGDEQGAAFPLFPWLVFPLLGMAYGQWFRRCGGNLQFYIRSVFTGIVLVGTGLLFNYFIPDFISEDYALLAPGSCIGILGFIVIWLSICSLLVNKVKPNKMFDLLYFWSRNVTVIYVLQWLLICWGSIFVGFQKMQVGSMLVSMLVVLILTDVLTRVWLRFKSKNTSQSLQEAVSAS